MVQYSIGRHIHRLGNFDKEYSRNGSKSGCRLLFTQRVHDSASSRNNLNPGQSFWNKSCEKNLIFCSFRHTCLWDLNCIGTMRFRGQFLHPPSRPVCLSALSSSCKHIFSSKQKMALRLGDKPINPRLDCSSLYLFLSFNLP